eukprot:TRINITY_DN3111_c0_g1_i1.p1 TRINITY_DN3111_c0_g1~~TRINITY_DN3111_c0_g1_i1.p1  ORF type:complete len:453 (-),score=81.54 TRINITY_DN3111_c0_g1_i1:205-1563(-)
MKNEDTPPSPQEQPPKSDHEDNDDEMSNPAADADTSHNTSTDSSLTTDSNVTVGSSEYLNESPALSTLFVGDLSQDVSEEHLVREFSPFGNIHLVEIKRDKATGLSLGYGFVAFRSRNEAVLAKLSLHRKFLYGRCIRVGWAHKNSNLFVGGLGPKVTTEELKKLFRPFGEIFEDETFAKRGYGFVRFKQRADAETAKAQLQGTTYFGERIHLGWGDLSTQRYCVFFQFDSRGEYSELLTEDDVLICFRRYGDIESLHLPRDRHGAPKGFGFVRYPDCERGEISATNAIREMNNDYLLLNSFRGKRGMVLRVKIRCSYGKRQVPHRMKFAQPTSPRENSSLSLYPGYINNEGLFIPDNYFIPPPNPQYNSTTAAPISPPYNYNYAYNHYNHPYIIDGRFAPLYLYPQPVINSQSPPPPPPPFHHAKQHPPAYSGAPTNNPGMNRGRRKHFAE